MRKGKKAAKKKGVESVAKRPKGRPTKYRPEMNEMVKNLCLLGATDDEVAEYLDINRDTYYLWKKTIPEFSDAILAGKIEADALVSKSLFEAAQRGDTSAAKFWLINRRPENWRDKQEVKTTIAHEQVFKIGDIELKF